MFGSACLPFLRPYNKSKLQFRSKKCVFLGYSSSHKGYICLHPSGRTYTSPTVEFHESEFPYNSLFQIPTPASNNPGLTPHVTYAPPNLHVNHDTTHSTSYIHFYQINSLILTPCYIVQITLLSQLLEILSQTIAILSLLLTPQFHMLLPLLTLTA